MTEKDWYIIDDVENLDTPILVVYPERVKKNIEILKSMIDDVARLRPHAKTFKNKETALLMMAAGINKFKCATIAEAEMLAMSGAADVLLAYQPVGPKLKRFIQLIAAYRDTKFACVADNAKAAAEIAEAASQHKINIPVYIDLNIGQNRTGINPGGEALQLYIHCAELPGITPVGLHAYDGHIHSGDIESRTLLADACFEPVIKLQENLERSGYNRPVIIAGGSPSYPIHAKRREIECSPGTFIYWDRGYQLAFEEQQFLTAALLITRVISRPGKSLICLDVGHKSVAAENVLSKRIYFPDAPRLVIVGQSEEHLVVDAGNNHNYQIGDVLYGLPYHICPTVALYERAITIGDNKITGEWKNIARDRKITI